jgi:large subunit ribosomal protein L10
LLGRAVEGTAMAGWEKLFVGPTAIAYSFEILRRPPRSGQRSRRARRSSSSRAAYVDGQTLDVKGVEALSKMPTKDELRSSFLALLVAAPQNFLALLRPPPADARGAARASSSRRRRRVSSRADYSFKRTH